MTHHGAGERGDQLVASAALHGHTGIGYGDVGAACGTLHDRKPRCARKRALSICVARATGRRYGTVQGRQIGCVHRVIARGGVARGASRAGIDGDVIRRQRRPREVGKGRAVAADAVTGRRVRRVFDLVRSAGGVRPRLEAHVLGRRHRRERRWIDRVLGHRHPGVATFVAVLTTRGDTGVDLGGGRRWRQEERPGRTVGRIRRTLTARHGGQVALLAVRAGGNVRRRAAGRRRRRHHDDFRNPHERRRSNRRAVAGHTRRNARVIHLGIREERAVGDRRCCDTGTRTDVADLARLGGRNVIRRGRLDDETRRPCKRPDGLTRQTMTLRAIGRLTRRVGVDIDQRGRDRIIGILMAIRASRCRRDRDVIGRLHLAGEVIEIGAVAGDAITGRGRRVRRVCNLIRPTGSTGSGLEAGVLGVRVVRARINRVLRHRHPNVTALVTTAAVRRHAGVDLCRRGDWR